MPKKDSNFNPIGKSRGLRGGRTAPADWASINAESIRRAIEAAANAGGALRFGYTADGGAYSIGIYGDGPPYTEYVKPGEPVEDILAEICELFDAIRDDLAQAKKAEK